MNTDRNFKILGILAIVSALILLEIIAFIVMKTGAIDFFKGLVKGGYQKPEAWVISQGLNSTLTKQQLLLDSAKNGQVTLEDLAKVATASTTVKAEAVKIGQDYLLSTGADGQVEVSVDPGTYKVELVTIPEVDFTGVPETVEINGGTNILSIGLVKGNGKVKSGSKDLAGQQPSDLRGRLIVSLFSDKNENGVKDSDEPDLPWAGVTIRLVKE